MFPCWQQTFKSPSGGCGIDMTKAVASLPAFTESATEATPPARATGTKSAGALNGALNSGRSRHTQSIGGTCDDSGDCVVTARKPKKTRATVLIRPKTQERAKGLEPSTSSLGS